MTAAPVTPAAVLVHDPVDRGPADPERGLVVAADAGPVLEGLDEGVLDGVRRGLGIARDDGQGADQAAVLGPEQRFELLLRVCHSPSTP